MAAACLWNAALLTRMSSCPSSRTVAATALRENRGSVGYIAGNEQRAASLGGHRGAGLVRVLLFAQIEKGNIRPFAGE